MTDPEGRAGPVRYRRELPCRAPRHQVFAAVATLGGLRRWWTPIVVGSVQPTGEVHFGFQELDEMITMRVDEVAVPQRVRWTCLMHTGEPAWSGSTIAFEVEVREPAACVLHFEHAGVDPDQVAAGWNRFLDSLIDYVETGRGVPYRAESDDALAVARAYHAAWTAGDVGEACRYLAPDLHTDVPINTYAGRDDFAAAVAAFGGLAERVELLAEFGAQDQALLLYDMHTRPWGRFRVAEQFTVSDGLIRGIRHVHDTAVLQGAT